jgi:hypothetical protein
MSRRRRRPAKRTDSSPRRRFFGPRSSATGWLLLGLVLGLAGSLYYAWIVDPVIFVNASPARLTADYRDQYLLLVSESYAVNGDWARAQSRLDALEEPDIALLLDDLLERALREQLPAQMVRNLANLAQQAGVSGQAIALFAPTPLSSAAPTPTLAIPDTPVPNPTVAATETAVSTSTPTLLPPDQPTPTLTPQPIYRLINQDPLCAADGDVDQIEIYVVDAFLNPLPGIAVIVTWQNGRDRFFTGLKPQIDPGYADFTMEPNVSYAVQLADGSPEVSGLRIEQCENSLDGGWRLTFQNLQFGATATPAP